MKKRADTQSLFQLLILSFITSFYLCFFILKSLSCVVQISRFYIHTALKAIKILCIPRKIPRFQTDICN